MSSSDDVLRLIVLVVAILLLAPIVLMVFVAPMMGMHGWGWTDSTGTGQGWILARLFPLVVVILIGYLVYRAAAGASARADDAAMEELRIAYARGEITDEEFEERRRRLQREE